MECASRLGWGKGALSWMERLQCHSKTSHSKDAFPINQNTNSEQQNTFLPNKPPANALSWSFSSQLRILMRKRVCFHPVHSPCTLCNLTSIPKPIPIQTVSPEVTGCLFPCFPPSSPIVFIQHLRFLPSELLLGPSPSLFSL